ncbi:MAG: aminotransferase class I/II-fold pyridoxal phosphate-dependent enzyme [Deltaproteobacteria bacterium]|jgi:arginine:pyruvate transaminase|nr:aminotransferase class I/II-fold pyridoxal phosphate-dependent enzyme [Deltaproteobacteria bacterium]
MAFAGRYSARVERLGGDASGVWAVHERASALRAAGEEVYLLSVGDPDLPTLPSTIDHAIESLREGRTHYAPGAGERRLREVVAGIEERSARRPCNPDDVIIFPGATNAIYSVMSCLLDEGDEVIVAEPMYIGYRGIFAAIGAVVVPVALDVGDGFRLSPESLSAAITDRTRVVFINTPGNPAGNMISAQELRALADLCLKRNIWLVSDEVYSMITFEERHVSLRTAAEQLENVVVIDGLSKSHAMTGWRLGWVVTHQNLVEHLLRFASSTVFGCCQFVQDAAAFALQNDEEYMAEVRAKYKKRRDFVCDRIASIPRIDCTVPKAGMFVMLDVRGLNTGGMRFAEDLLEEQRVSVLPGEGFGSSTRDYVRLSLAQPLPYLEEAMDRIERFVSARGVALVRE